MENHTVAWWGLAGMAVVMILLSLLLAAWRRWPDMEVRINTNDLWIGYYRGETHHYVCLLPVVVISWKRHVAITKTVRLPTVSTCGYCGKPRW